MNNTNLPGEPANLSGRPGEDIPVAVRDTPDIRRPSRLKPILLVVGLLGLGAITLSLLLLQPNAQRQSAVDSSQEDTSRDDPTLADQNDSERETDNILGHLPYEEAPLSELEPITPDGRIKLRAAAAKKFKAMSAAAQADGVRLVPISGFRSIQDQQHLFFDIKAQRGQVTAKRAEVSAPPGYSEHHTGYAIDIGDARTPATNLSPSFEKTAAFKWLEKNAAYYSFELSFPRDNPQGISYEPWHWRFVGDSHSLETFYKVRDLSPPLSSPLNPGSESSQ